MASALVKRLIVAPFHCLEPHLTPTLAAMAEGDPLRPRRVLLISNRLRDHLQRRLAREGALAGVYFLTLEQFAREIAESTLLQEGLRPLPPIAGPALMETILKENHDRLTSLRQINEMRGYGHALYETWKDLKEGGLDSSDLLACARKSSKPDARRLTDLAFLVTVFEERLDKIGWFDEIHLLNKAIKVLDSDPSSVPTILYGFSDMNALQRRLSIVTCRDVDAAAFVPADRDAPPCAFAVPFIEWLKTEGFSPVGNSLGETGPFDKLGKRLFGMGDPIPAERESLQIVSAPAASREAYELCREVFAERENPHLPKSAGFLLVSRNEYALLLREILGGLGVSADFDESVSCAACPAGRVYLRMLSLRQERYPRLEVMRFLDEGGLCGSAFFIERVKEKGLETDTSTLPAEWEYLSREFPFVSGEESWRKVLRHALSEEPHLSGLKTLIVALDGIFEQMAFLPSSARPSVHAEESLKVFLTLTSGLGQVEKVAEAVRSLGELDEVLGEIPAEVFLWWVRLALEGTSLLEEANSSRIQVMTLQQSRGLSFDTVVIPGFAEGVFPSQGSQDPILPDVTRAQINVILGKVTNGSLSRLPLKSERIKEERFLFWTALQTAERRVVIGYPRGGIDSSLEGGRPPSLFLEYLWEAMGEHPDEAASGQAHFRSSPGALDYRVMKKRSMTLLEHTLSEMLEQLHGNQQTGALGHLVQNRASFCRRIFAWRDRWEKDKLTPFDGNLSSPDLLLWLKQVNHPEKTSVTVTSLETFFSCPYQFALRHLLKLQEKEEPELSLEAASDLRGNLYHEVLRRFAECVKRMGKKFGEIRAEIRRSLVSDAVQDTFQAFQDDFRMPFAVPRRILRDAIERDLNTYLERTYSSSSAWRPVEMEGRFGGKENPQEVFTDAERMVRVRGRFDLLEQDGDSNRFIDYKSGSSVRVKKIPSLDGGTYLQADLYAHCAKSRIREGARVSAAYAFIAEQGRYRLAEIPSEIIEERQEDVKALLGFYVQMVENGGFFPTPSRSCDYCDFISVCGPDRGGRANRKKGDAFWIALDELRERTR